MSLAPAPFHAATAEAPSGMQACWTHAQDGTRLRIAHCPAEVAARGTVLMFPGRTEYVEKYGRTAADFARRGYALAAIDWRGQGLADRLLDEPRAGHVSRFGDYQMDVAALIETAKALDLPRPWHLLGHSMGGCIGLRALYDDMPVASAAFTAPMWGIGLPAPLRHLAVGVAGIAMTLGMGHRFAPSTGPKNYVTGGAFDGNSLTSDPDMWAYMRRQMQAQPALEIGGPTLQWLREALIECRALAARPAPSLTCLSYLGGNESIVSPEAIHDRMRTWDGGQLRTMPGKEHELLMEDLTTRSRVADEITAHFDAAGKAAPASLRI